MVWNNSDLNELVTWSPKVEHVFADRNQAILPRFALATLADAGPVLILDDDLSVPETTLERLYGRFLEQPDIVHGLYGRRPRHDGTYADFYDHDNAGVEMVLGRCVLFDRKLLGNFFNLWHSPAITQLCIESESRGYSKHPGDDIVLSYAAMLGNRGKLNKVWNYERAELSAEHAMTDIKGHFEIREKVMQYCQGLL